MKTAILAGPGARRLLFGLAVAAACLATPIEALAACGCPYGGVPRILGSRMRGNDLNEIRGDCAFKGKPVELQVRQRHFYQRSSLPPATPQPFESTCINGCQWITIGSTTADPITGHFKFLNLDQSHSVQLISSLSSVAGLDSVRTDLRVRAWDSAKNRWTSWTAPPTLEAFALLWTGHEDSMAQAEARVTGADKMFITVADGPDDGDQPTIPLDVDTDTPNYWLGYQSGDPTVVYHFTGTCDPPFYACPSSWLVQLAPTITVGSPAFGRQGEYPFVMGMASATRAGAMMIATSVEGPRDISDFSIEVEVDVDVDVSIDLDLGIDFFSIF
ncbi:MAG: hypothetical protein FJ144_01305 [Deltaproteobacteria bacterium]|nr:hypothetical protein [Deltaproteobacteria bacterium]